MLQGHCNGNRGQRRNFLPNHPVNPNLWQWCDGSNHVTEWRTIDHRRRRGHFHLAGNIDVVSRIGFRIVLAIFSDCGKSRNGNEQKQHANAEAKPPVGCDFAKKAFPLLLNIHSRMQTTGSFS